MPLILGGQLPPAAGKKQSTIRWPARRGPWSRSGAMRERPPFSAAGRESDPFDLKGPGRHGRPIVLSYA